MLQDAQGGVLAQAGFQSLPPPDDLLPKTQPVTLSLPPEVPPGSVVRLVLDGQPLEISRQNNQAPSPKRRRDGAGTPGCLGLRGTITIG
jgi:hypothetical protein